MAAKFCAHCGNEVSSAAKFCPNCAAPLTPPAASALTAHPVDAAAVKTRSLLLPAAIVAVLVLAVALAVLAGKSRQQPSLIVSQPPETITAPAVTNAPTLPPQAAPPLTNAPAQPPATGPAITNAPNKPAPTLPPDVAAYLNFLQGIEQKRIAMNADTSKLMETLTVAQGLQSQATSSDSDDPSSGGGQTDTKQSTLKKISDAYSEQVINWQILNREFRTSPAPPTCTQIANRYSVFLSDYTTVASKMQVALLNLNANGATSPVDAFAFASKAQAGVDADGTQADGALTDLCARYGVQKPFTISPEGASPSLLGH